MTHPTARMFTVRFRGAALIAVMILAATWGACSSKHPSVEAAASLPGRALFETKNCVLCHGPDAEGLSSGPKLRNLSEHYTSEQLIEYLKDPSAYAATDARLSKQGGEYPAMMPKYGYLEAEQLAQLAEYVLALKE